MTSHPPKFADQPPTGLREKLAQLVIVRIGSNLPPVRTVDEDTDQIARLLERTPVGGLLLFNGRWPATPESLGRLQQLARYPLLVASDVERGVGQQIRGKTLFPHAMAFDMLGERAPAAVAEFARNVAAEARESGIQIAFAPVADVNIDPQNPIIATRAFGQDPERVAELVEAYVRAAEASGVLTVPKHFPGHGNTHQDSHDSLPVVASSRDELDQCELLPFRAAIRAGASIVMTAHVAYPALDPSGTPATLSEPILAGLLREKLGFEGAICTDSLLMAGVRERFETEGELALAALQAGADMLLDVAGADDVVDYLERAIEAGVLDESRVDASLARVWELKRRAFGRESAGAIPAEESDTPAGQLADEIARGAIAVYGPTTAPAITRLSPDQPLTALLVKPYESHLDPPEQPLGAALRARFADVDYAEIGPQATHDEYQSQQARALAADQLVIAMIVKPAAWHRFGLLPEQTELVQSLTERRPAVLASLGVPYCLEQFPAAAVRLCTYSDVPCSQQALAEVLWAGWS